MMVFSGQKLAPLTAQQNSENPEQQVLPQPHPALPHSQIEPYAVPGRRARSRPEPTATALPTKADRLMRLRRDRRPSRARAVRATSAVEMLTASGPAGAGRGGARRRA